MTEFIYGLFEGKRCRYIGRTRTPAQRKTHHRSKHPKLDFRVFCECSSLQRADLERAFVSYWRSLGQADLSIYPRTKKV